MKTYNKLVRDNIPDIINKSGSQCTTEILSDKDYLDAMEYTIQAYKDNKIVKKRWF